MFHRVRKKGTNDILGITSTKFNKFSQLLAQFMLTCQLTKKIIKVPSLLVQHYVITHSHGSVRVL